MPSIIPNSIKDTVIPYVYVDKIRIQRIIDEKFVKLPPTQIYSNGTTNFGKPVSYSDNFLRTETRSNKRLSINLNLFLDSETTSRYLRDQIVHVCTFVCRNFGVRSYLESGNFSFFQLNDLIIKGFIDFYSIDFTTFNNDSKKSGLSVSNTKGLRQRIGSTRYSYDLKVPLRVSDPSADDLSVFTFILITDRKVGNPSAITTFPMFGYSYGPMAGFLVSQKGVLNKRFYTLNDKYGNIWAGGYHKDFSKNDIDSFKTGLTFSGVEKNHASLKARLFFNTTKVLDQVVIENLDDSIPVANSYGTSTNVAQQSPTSPSFLKKGLLNETNVYRNLTYISPLYTSIDPSGIASTIFHIDKKNIIKSYSRFGNYISEITDPVTLSQIYSLTILKNIKITREYNDIVEIVGDFQIDKELNYLEKIVFNRKIEKVKGNNVVFSVLQKINTFEQNTSMNSYVFKDYFVNSSLRDKFKYKLELTFDDGFEKLLESKYIKLLEETRYLQNIHNLLNVQKLFDSKGNFSTTLIDKITKSSLKNSMGFTYGDSIPTSEQIDMKLKYIIVSYLDLLMLVKQSAVDSPESYIESIMSLISVKDGNIKEYDKVMTKLENFKKQVASNLNLSIILQTDQRVIDSNPKQRKENKDEKMKIQTYSDFVFAKTKDTTLVENISAINNGDEYIFPELNLPGVVTTVLNNLTSPQKVYIDNLSYEIGTNYSEMFVLVHNQSKGLDANPSRVGVYSSETSLQVSKEELGARKRILDGLGSSGISILGATYADNGSTNRSLIESSLYLNNFNTPEESAKQSNIDTNNKIDVNFPLDLSTVIAKDFMTSDRNSYSTKQISEYPKIFFTEMLKFKIQYLEPYPASNDALSITQFTEQWVDLTADKLSVLEENRILLARTIVEGGDLRDINVQDKLNISHVNQYFLLKTSDISNLLNVQTTPPNSGVYGVLPFNPYLSQILTFPDQVHNTSGVNVIYNIDYLTLKRMFGFSFLIDNPLQVKVFGTNYDAIIGEAPVYSTEFTQELGNEQSRRQSENDKERRILEIANPSLKLDNVAKNGINLNPRKNPTTKLGY